MTPISQVEGLQLMEQISAVKYFECSAITQEGVARIFQEAVRVSLYPPPPLVVKGGEEKCRCLVQ